MTFPTRRRGAPKWSSHGQSRNWSRIVALARSFTIGDRQWGRDGDQLAEEGGSLVLHLAVAVAVILSCPRWRPRDSGAGITGIHKSDRGQVGRRRAGEMRDRSISHVTAEGRKEIVYLCGGERGALVWFDRVGLLAWFARAVLVLDATRYPLSLPLPCWSPH